jgi:hypothetical protein
MRDETGTPSLRFSLWPNDSACGALGERMRGQRMPRRGGNAVRDGIVLLLAGCLMGCALQHPVAYRYPSQSYANNRLQAVRKPTGELPRATASASVSCAAQAELTDADKAELFRQFEDWQKSGGTLPPPRRQTADGRPPCTSTP